MIKSTIKKQLINIGTATARMQTPCVIISSVGRSASSILTLAIRDSLRVSDPSLLDKFYQNWRLRFFGNLNK